MVKEGGANEGDPGLTGQGLVLRARNAPLLHKRGHVCTPNILHHYLAGSRIIFRFSNTSNYIAISVYAIIRTVALNTIPSSCEPYMGGNISPGDTPDSNSKIYGRLCIPDVPNPMYAL